MPIDNVTWHARVVMFYALKPFFKSKSSAKIFSEFLNTSIFKDQYVLTVTCQCLNDVVLIGFLLGWRTAMSLVDLVEVFGMPASIVT